MTPSPPAAPILGIDIGGSKTHGSDRLAAIGPPIDAVPAAVWSPG
mgnify:CR=1 FL=1